MGTHDSKMKFLSLVIAVVLVASLAAATPEKPVWPNEFSYPFGLNSGVPYFTNASSEFYYNWDYDGGAQMINYHTHCLPLVHWNAAFYPCQLWFNNELGIVYSSPQAQEDCCFLWRRHQVQGRADLCHLERGQVQRHLAAG